MLDPQARALLDAMPPIPDLDSIPLDLLRQRMAAQNALAPDARPVPVGNVEDRAIPGPDGEIPVRVYTPEGTGPFPVLVYFHGGGFVLCDLDTHDGTCRSLCRGAEALVVSVDYRLAPEHPYPAGPEDCYAATRWVAENAGSLGGDPSRIAIGGDSAGGNLTAVVALMARDRRGPSLRFQLLIYPVTNRDFETPSYRDNAEGYFLSADMMRWFWRHYLTDPVHGEQAYASPLRAEDLSGLPPALCITAGYDPLRDEGEAYAERLREAGNAVVLSRYPGMIHGFFGMDAVLDEARRAVAEASEALRKALR